MADELLAFRCCTDMAKVKVKPLGKMQLVVTVMMLTMMGKARASNRLYYPKYVENSGRYKI